MRRIVAIITTSAMSLVIVSPANARANEPRDCYSWSCTGLDPSKTNCVEDAVTIMRYGIRNEGGAYGNLDLRYSKRCHSNWARFSSDSGFRALWQLKARVSVTGARPWIWRPVSGLPPQGVVNQAHGIIGSSYWTVMITADGTTCTSVDVLTMDDPPGHNKFSPGTGHVKQNFNAPCVS